jgi:hypothetical protein
MWSDVVCGSYVRVKSYGEAVGGSVTDGSTDRTVSTLTRRSD